MNKSAYKYKSTKLKFLLPLLTRFTATNLNFSRKSKSDINAINFDLQALIIQDDKKNFLQTAPRHLLTSVYSTLAKHLMKPKFGMAAIALLAISASLIAPAAYAANLLFNTDMSPSSFKLDTPKIMSGNAEAGQFFNGINPTTGIMGPVTALSTTGSFLQMIIGQQIKTTLTDYIANEIQQVIGPNGNQVSALHQIIKDNTPAINSTGYTQDAFLLQRSGISQDTGDVYYSYWLKFQPDLHTQLTKGGNGDWRVVTEWKTSGDYRTIVIVGQDGNGNLSWHIQGDNNANGPYPYQIFWYTNNTTVPVPVGKWFKFEIFWHRGTNGGTDGRYWTAVNGQVLADHKGAMYPVNPVLANPAPIDRMFITNVYSGGNQPVEQWVTDLQIWNGFPCGVGVSCYNSTPTAPITTQPPSTGGVPTGYTWCANENGKCSLIGTVDVAYGANGLFSYKYNQTGIIGCNNATFGGDPINGVAKSCYVSISPTTTPLYGPKGAPSGYTWCADEYGKCSLIGTVDVAYGANGLFSYKYNQKGSIVCNNATFGGDPINNVVKSCYVSISPTTTPLYGTKGAPSGYTWCADEYGKCSLIGTVDVAYGANGLFSYKYNQKGSIVCNNATFGGDPINNVVKSCYVSASN
jgi:hypothetical protein